MKPLILKQWGLLSEYDLADIQISTDCLVELIRQKYSPTRTKLSIEADIEDWITGRLSELEREEDFIRGGAV